MLLPAAGVCLSGPRRVGMDGPARPHVLSFDLRRGAPGAGLVAAGAETSHSPLVGSTRRIRAFLPHG